MLGILSSGLLAYSNSFSGVFLLDDIHEIVNNPSIRQIWPPWTALFGGSEAGGWMRPIVNGSLALNFAVSGIETWSYHAINLLIHLSAALVLFGILRRALKEDLTSFFISAVWMLHPVQTESVTYIIQRGESLVGLFYLLTLYFFIRQKRAWSVVACVLGMMTKAVMITAPIAVLLYDAAFLSGSIRVAFRKNIRYYLTLFSTWGIVVLLVSQAPPTATQSAGLASKDLTPVIYATIQLPVIFQYLKLAFWPASLCFDYWWIDWDRTPSDYLASLAVLCLLAFTIYGWAKGHRKLAFLGAWFFLTLAPTSSFIPLADIIVEHRMYLALAAVVSVFFLLVRRAPSRVMTMAGVLTMLIFSFLTFQRNTFYHGEEKMWRDVIEKRPGNARAHCNLGLYLASKGREEEAVPFLEKTTDLDPEMVEAYDRLGIWYGQRGEVAKSERYFREALRWKPDDDVAHNNLGIVLHMRGKPDEAKRHFEEALRLNPKNESARNNLNKF